MNNAERFRELLSELLVHIESPSGARPWNGSFDDRGIVAGAAP
jgi:hypothetical protein